jgi:hypothetical protein
LLLVMMLLSIDKSLSTEIRTAVYIIIIESACNI